MTPVIADALPDVIQDPDTVSADTRSLHLRTYLAPDVYFLLQPLRLSGQEVDIWAEPWAGAKGFVRCRGSLSH